MSSKQEPVSSINAFNLPNQLKYMMKTGITYRYTLASDNLFITRIWKILSTNLSLSRLDYWECFSHTNYIDNYQLYQVELLYFTQFTLHLRMPSTHSVVWIHQAKVHSIVSIKDVLSYTSIVYLSQQSCQMAMISSFSSRDYENHYIHAFCVNSFGQQQQLYMVKIRVLARTVHRIFKHWS